MKKQLSKPVRNKNGGFTLIELLVVSVIIFTMIGGVIAMFSDAGDAQKVNTQVQNDTRLVAAIRDYFRNDYTGLTTEVVIAARLAPEDIVNAAGDALFNEWRGNVGIASATVNSPNDAFTIVSDSIPGEDCAKYIESIEELFITVSIGGVEVKARNGELDRIALSAECVNEAILTGVVF